jgi:hypothetical protein
MDAEATRMFAELCESVIDKSYRELRDLFLDHERAEERVSPSGKRYVFEVLAYWDDQPDGALRVFVTLTPASRWRWFPAMSGDFIKTAPDSPLAPFFEFNSSDEGEVFVFDKPGHINQEPPELEEYGPDPVFDSSGRSAELGVEGFGVVIKRWSEPNVDQFDRHLRVAAARHIPEEDISALGTFELRDRLETGVRKWQREHALFWPVQKFARNLWWSVSRRSG